MLFDRKFLYVFIVVWMNVCVDFLFFRGNKGCYFSVFFFKVEKEFLVGQGYKYGSGLELFWESKELILKDLDSKQSNVRGQMRGGQLSYFWVLEIMQLFWGIVEEYKGKM